MSVFVWPGVLALAPLATAWPLGAGCWARLACVSVVIAQPSPLSRAHAHATQPWPRPARSAIEASPAIADIRRRVEEFAGAFPMPGFDVSGL